MGIEQDWDRLLELTEQWQQVFGGTFGFGGAIYPEDLPLIEECLSKKSTKPLDDHFAKLADEGIVL